MSKVFINGVSFTGDTIKVKNNQVFVDGVEANIGNAPKILEIRIVEGVVNQLEADGSVTAQAVKGSITAGGSVHCDCVGGSVSAGGSVSCGRVGGAVTAGGGVRHA